jgi:hypothetical protein
MPWQQGTPRASRRVNGFCVKATGRQRAFTRLTEALNTATFAVAVPCLDTTPSQLAPVAGLLLHQCHIAAAAVVVVPGSQIRTVRGRCRRSAAVRRPGRVPPPAVSCRYGGGCSRGNPAESPGHGKHCWRDDCRDRDAVPHCSEHVRACASRHYGRLSPLRLIHPGHCHWFSKPPRRWCGLWFPPA